MVHESRGLMMSISSPDVQENKVSSPKIQTQHIIKQRMRACEVTLVVSDSLQPRGL